MYIFFNIYITLISLWFIGAIFTVHLKKKKFFNLLSVSTGLAFLVNAAYLLNFSKIAISKPFFDNRLFNAIGFITFIVILISIFSLLNIKRKALNTLWIYLKRFLVISLIVSVIIPIFISKLGDDYVSNRANELKNQSIAYELVAKQTINNDIWQVGQSLLSSIHSTIFDISTDISTGIIHGIVIFLLLYIISITFFKYITSGKFFKILSYLALVGLFLSLFLSITMALSLILLAISILLILYCEYINILKSKLEKNIHIEELLIALFLVLIASISSIVFKLILLGIAIGGLYFFVNKKRTEALLFIRPLLFAILINPVILGLVF